MNDKEIIQMLLDNIAFYEGYLLGLSTRPMPDEIKKELKEVSDKFKKIRDKTNDELGL